MKISKIKVKKGQTNYPILIGLGAINRLKSEIKTICPDAKKIALIFDNKIPKKFKSKIKNQTKNYRTFSFEYNVTENLKSFPYVNELSEKLLSKNFNRNDIIIAIGGGVIGDYAGFSSSIIKRGLNFINIPSTFLAQVDSAIGGKTGINTNKGKNLIGTFSQPKLVISELGLLNSLPKRDMICGFAEVLKHAIIKDKDFFNWIEKRTKEIIINKNMEVIKSAIIKSCKIKIFFVTRDEKEKGDRAKLNFGHTFAHGLEGASNFSKKINHGEAVLVGMYLATKLSKQKNICSAKTYDRIKNFYKINNLPNNLKKYSLHKKMEKIIKYMINDKKNNDSKISLILLRKIGKTTKPGSIKIKPKTMSLILKNLIQS